MRSSGKSPAYIRRCATVLARALDLARKRGLIDSNPAKDATRPRTTRTKPFAPTGDEVRAVLAEAQGRDPEIADAGTVLASTGMRRGEFLATRWCDLRLDQAEVHVAAAITDGGPGVGVIRKPTKRSDWRDVPLTGAACQALKRQAERRAALIGSAPDPDEYVFPRGIDGRRPMRPDEMTNRWTNARGSSPITIQHLRHYAATAMLDAGESYRTVADILGNSEATLRLHYDGRTDVGKRKAITALELGLTPAPSTSPPRLYTSGFCVRAKQNPGDVARPGIAPGCPLTTLPRDDPFRHPSVVPSGAAPERRTDPTVSGVGGW
jgi:integrase